MLLPIPPLIRLSRKKAWNSPPLARTAAMIVKTSEMTTSAIEIGIPFSDPMAEGPTIQRASERALAGGVTSLLYIPGSGTNIGGQGVLIKSGFDEE